MFFYLHIPKFIYIYIYCLCSYLGSPHFLFKMASHNRSYARSKSTIGFGRLQELMKQHMGDGPRG